MLCFCEFRAFICFYFVLNLLVFDLLREQESIHILHSVNTNICTIESFSRKRLKCLQIRLLGIFLNEHTQFRLQSLLDKITNGNIVRFKVKSNLGLCDLKYQLILISSKIRFILDELKFGLYYMQRRLTRVLLRMR